jgi:hypothetical protein
VFDLGGVRTAYNGTYKVHRRDVVEVARQLLHRRDLRELIAMYGVKRKSAGTDGKRIWAECWQSRRWWRMQDELEASGKTGNILAVIVGSDATQLTTMTGSHKAHPVYISFGNFPKTVRQKSTSETVVCVGLIPIMRGTDVERKTKEFRAAKLRLFHMAY